MPGCFPAVAKAVFGGYVTAQGRPATDTIRTKVSPSKTKKSVWSGNSLELNVDVFENFEKNY